MLHKPNASLTTRSFVKCSALHYGYKPLSSGSRIAMMATEATREAKKSGTIADVFTTLGPKADVAPLPARFSALKKEVLRDMSMQPGVLQLAWKRVLEALEPRVREIIALGGDIIPRISYEELHAHGLSESQRDAIRKTGVVVVTGGVPKEEALDWKRHIKSYIAANPVKGFPAENIQAYELYNTKPQLYARTHDALLNTQRALLSLWHSSASFPDAVDFTVPISYFDRLRIRTPGDRSFTLGPHIDGGSVERWEDPGFRRVWGKILSGGESGWEAFDPFDATWRVNAKQDLYNAPNQCTILRCWQGWTSMSFAGVNEGTLRVLPMLSLATAYIILRPFFKPRGMTTLAMNPSLNSVSLAAENWELNLEGGEFPGSIPGKTQELNEITHPHLRLGETMVSIPRIEPGDQVYWHCDTVHAVEGEHKGKEDSSVLYIPAVPLCVKNAAYLRSQRTNFARGLPAPDFPGGEGESAFLGRATPQDITTRQGRQATGFEPFVATSANDAALLQEANKILFG